MGLYGFKPQFWRYVLDGSKSHTIRCPRRYPDSPGKVMHLFGKVRKPDQFLLMRATCLMVRPITLDREVIELGGVRLSRDERDGLAWADGFRPPKSTRGNPGPAFELMAGFWRASLLPLVATINYWEYPPLEFGDRSEVKRQLAAIGAAAPKKAKNDCGRA